MYHDDGPKARAIMVPPPMPPPAPALVMGSSNTGTLSSTGSAGSVAGAGDKFAVPNAPDKQELPTPSSTPTTSRKNRRRSNLFTPSKKQTDDSGLSGQNGSSLGSGRSIPVKQGLLYKKTNNSFSKDWKKKYVTLCDDGRMTYHPSLNDYMSNVHGKEIPLQCVTVKVPGQKPRGSRTVNQPNAASNNAELIKSNGVNSAPSKTEKVLLTGYEMIRDENTDNNNEDLKERTTPNVKKRHQKKGVKSNGVKTSSTSVYSDNGALNNDGETGETFEFHIVSLDNKQWHFEAGSAEDRDEWVSAIEQQILSSLQGIESSKAKSGHSASVVDLAAMKAIKSDIPGNDKCVDCDAPSKNDPL